MDEEREETCRTLGEQSEPKCKVIVRLQSLLGSTVRQVDAVRSPSGFSTIRLFVEWPSGEEATVDIFSESDRGLAVSAIDRRQLPSAPTWTVENWCWKVVHGELYVRRSFHRYYRSTHLPHAAPKPLLLAQLVDRVKVINDT